MTIERPQIAEGLEIEEVDDGLIVYQESVERVHHLNPTASVVFQLCDGSRDAASIATAVGTLFGLEDPPRDEVDSCLSRFLREGLLR
jgi:Coenzyme PQQ synthesis protein D (PqqD)